VRRNCPGPLLAIARKPVALSEGAGQSLCVVSPGPEDRGERKRRKRRLFCCGLAHEREGPGAAVKAPPRGSTRRRNLRASPRRGRISPDGRAQERKTSARKGKPDHDKTTRESGKSSSGKKKKVERRKPFVCRAGLRAELPSGCAKTRRNAGAKKERLEQKGNPR